MVVLDNPIPDASQTLPMTSWDHFLDVLRAQEAISSVTFDTWIAPLTLLGQEEGSFHLLAPDELFATWVEDNISAQLEDVYRQTFGGDVRLRVSYPTGVGAPRAGKAAPRPELNPNFTFERFVHGKANGEAYTAARSVAERPAASFNPFFIAGDVGLGKTHLVQAIGHHLAQHHPGLAVRYLSGEAYVNGLIAALRSKKPSAIDDYRAQFRRECDVLLIDDLQFIIGKDRSQEEFFHTFNELYNAGKQIVMCGNQLPSDIPNLSERLRSRLQWNLVVQIEAPDLPLRVRILEDKARRLDLPLSEEVAHHLASHIDSNVRNLESALANLHFRCKLMGSEPTVALADQVLEGLYHVAQRPPITAEMIMQAVARVRGVKLTHLRSGTRDRAVVGARQLALALCREHTDLSAPALASLFGVGSHATVLSAEKKIAGELRVNANLRKERDEVLALLEDMRRPT